MIKRYVLIIVYLMIIISLISCGFHGSLTRTETGFKWEANRPCVIKDKDVEIDGKGQPLIDLKMPDVVASKLGT